MAMVPPHFLVPFVLSPGRSFYELCCGFYRAVKTEWRTQGLKLLAQGHFALLKMIENVIVCMGNSTDINQKLENKFLWTTKIPINLYLFT